MDRLFTRMKHEFNWKRADMCHIYSLTGLSQTLVFILKHNSIPLKSGSKSHPLFRLDGIGMGIPLKSGIRTIGTRGNILLGSRLGGVLFNEDDVGTKIPTEYLAGTWIEASFCRDRDDRDKKIRPTRLQSCLNIDGTLN